MANIGIRNSSCARQQRRIGADTVKETFTIYTFREAID
jgi:hypothetical protein